MASSAMRLALAMNSPSSMTVVDLRFGLRKGQIQFVETPNLHVLELHIHCLRHFVHSSQDRGHREIVRVHEDTCTIETRHQAFHELQTLRIDLGKEKR